MHLRGCTLLVLGLLLGPADAGAPADPVGVIKVAAGAVSIERAGMTLPAPVGARVLQSDRIVTGPDGSVGIAFRDDSLVSSGPNGVLEIERFVFDSTTHEGGFDASLKRGTLSVVSGKIARQSPGAMKVRTPAAVLAVRGTEFAVKAEPVYACGGTAGE